MRTQGQPSAVVGSRLGPDAYRRAIEDHRRAKDVVLRSSRDSPIPAHVRAGFAGLRYFDVDRRFRVQAPPIGSRGPEKRIVNLQTSDGGLRAALHAGVIQFTLLGRSFALAAFRFGGQLGGPLFVPFRDATSGRESYLAGRYLEVEPGPDGSLVLDFNLAYQPYCAYSRSYSCPLPPPENELAILIQAGERLAPDPGPSIRLRT